ncbi:hypothetical protein [Demequina salsinemoris]|uniref:hypothetical protein n=1 Tax=Demequina salsinemoris TaxID=577470 RepID=UPI000785E29C|nr:hypothetical protein [Demequina salsinemoris]
MRSALAVTLLAAASLALSPAATAATSGTPSPTASSSSTASSSAAPSSAAPAEQGYSFPDSCDASSINISDSDCVDGRTDIDLHEDGTATWVSQTAYPRAAFDAYLVEYEGWDGTTQEYMDEQLADSEDSTGTSEATVTDDLVLVDITYELTGDDAYQTGFALAADDELYVAIAVDDVAGSSTVTLTAPGTIQEANGYVDGTTVTWDAELLAGTDELDVNALTSIESDGSLPVWLWLVGGALLAVIGVAGWLGFGRRAGDDG